MCDVYSVYFMFYFLDVLEYVNFMTQQQQLKVIFVVSKTSAIIFYSITSLFHVTLLFIERLIISLHGTCCMHEVQRAGAVQKRFFMPVEIVLK